MSHILRVGVADQIAYFRAYNTDGTAKTDLTSSTTGLTLSVFRVGASSVSIASLSNKAADDTAHADGAIRNVGGNLYTIDLPDAACATQVPSICVRGSYTGGVVEGLEHPIVAYDPSVVAVGANTTTPPTVDAIADQVWDEVLTGATHNIPTSAGRRLRQLASVIVHSGTAQGAGTGNNQIQFDTGASSTNGAYDPGLVYIETGTGAGQTRLILQYNGSTRTATVDRDWRVNPDNTSEFVILGDAGREHANEGLAQAGTATTITLNANASSDDDAYNGQLVFIRSGTGQDQVALVEDYVGSTKVATIKTRSATGQWAVTPDTTSAYVMMPNLTWTLSEIAAAIDITVAPLQATAPSRVAGTEIVTYINDTSDIGPIVVTDGDGNAVDLSSYTLKVCIERKENGTIDDNITPTISGAGNNQVTFTPTAACVNSTTPRKWSLRSTSNGQVFAFGDFKVEWPARLS